jgi:hypothetical protein
MKLNEIKRVYEGEVNLAEGVIPVHIAITLDQIINAGKVTNSVQYFILAGLISMFKDGGPTRWPRDLNSYSMSTSSEQIDAIKTISDNEAVELAKWLGQELMNPVNFETNPYANSSQDVVEWIRFVLKKQD